ncbi:uncharacterized protein BDZ99DRAFT_565506 [Mytilinidion resinicola]|uniref:Uncharacterized protein n=1 Tax=Mytilinidion resinicola TaxID=574789 RepID=A0A6A6Z9V7_9PEZI|nr:uncharacterized protein BDZ99DRAFT_565506 [Mytilinidion resinicola]KAF2817912.1 hypothetical protein BDZ99DRAFT_565506 [Mytilinidion resinicola]
MSPNILLRGRESGVGSETTAGMVKRVAEGLFLFEALGCRPAARWTLRTVKTPRSSAQLRSHLGESGEWCRPYRQVVEAPSARMRNCRCLRALEVVDNQDVGANTVARMGSSEHQATSKKAAEQLILLDLAVQQDGGRRSFYVRSLPSPSSSMSEGCENACLVSTIEQQLWDKPESEVDLQAG